MSCLATSSAFGKRAQPRRDAPREKACVRCASLTAAVVPQIDHRVGKRLQRVVHLTDALELKQQAPKLENHLAGLPTAAPAGDGVKVSLHRTL